VQLGEPDLVRRGLARDPSGWLESQLAVALRELEAGEPNASYRRYLEHLRRPGWLPSHDRPWASDEPSRVSDYGAKLVVDDRDGAELRAIAGEVRVPGNFKFIQLKAPPKPKKRDGDYIMPETEYEPETASDPAPISPGDIADIQLFFTEKTARMKLYGDNNEVVVTTEKTGSQRMSWKQGLIHLVQNHGLTEKQARDMLQEAQVKGSFAGAVAYNVKYAMPFPYETAGPGPGAPAFPGAEMGTEQHGYNQTAAIYPQEEFIPVDGLQSNLTDPSIYDPFLMPDQNAVSMAQQAGQQGQKEVFDVSMISGLLKSVRQDSLVDRYLGDLMKALDRLGRMLFLFYWHGEEFEDRYGRQDIPELEDSLRNAFETLGDVTLFLKEKTIDVGEDQMGDPDIEEAAKN
jgi:hypothetical protein